MKTKIIYDPTDECHRMVREQDWEEVDAVLAAVAAGKHSGLSWTSIYAEGRFPRVNAAGRRLTKFTVWNLSDNEHFGTWTVTEDEALAIGIPYFTAAVCRRTHQFFDIRVSDLGDVLNLKSRIVIADSELPESWYQPEIVEPVPAA